MVVGRYGNGSSEVGMKTGPEKGQEQTESG